jgi:hypothetical protein
MTIPEPNHFKRTRDIPMKTSFLATLAVAMIALISMGDASAKDKSNPDHQALAKKLKAAVKSGDLTEAEAKAKWAAITKNKATDSEIDAYFKGASKDATHAYIEKVWQKLQAEVEAGTMTKDEALAKISEIKKAKLGDKKKTGNERQLVWDALQTHVKAGHLTPQQAKTAMIAIKKTGELSKTY